MSKAFILFASLATASAAQSMTLEEAVAMTIDGNPQVSEQYAILQSTLRQKRAAAASFYPRVSVRAEVSEEESEKVRGENVDNNFSPEEYNLTISQLLFDGFRTSADVDRLDQEALADRYALLADADNLALDVAGAYLGVLREQSLVDLAEKNVVDHEAVVADIEGRLKKGWSSESDLAQANARLASSKSSLLSSRNNLMDEEAEFYTLVGVYPEGLINPMVDQSSLPANLGAVLDKARAQHPQIQSAIADMQAAQQEIRNRKADYYPEVYLDLSAHHDDEFDGLEGENQYGRITLRVEYDLYDGGRRKAQTESSAWRRESAYSLRRNTERQVVEGAKLAWNARDFLGQKEDVLQFNVKAALDAERGYGEQFKIGRRSLLDVLDAKIEVFVARRNFVRNHYDRILAEYRVHNATGDLIGALSISAPQEWVGAAQ